MHWNILNVCFCHLIDVFEVFNMSYFTIFKVFRPLKKLSPFVKVLQFEIL